MRPPFAYYGGKVGMARQIVGLFPKHRVYIEPFFGSGAVLFAKPRSPFEIVNDINQALVTFWRVLRERPDDLAHVCDLTPHSRSEYEDAQDLTGANEDLEIARRWWVRINQGFAKTADPTTGWSLSTATGRSIPLTTLNRVGRFGPAVQRLVGVSLEQCDAVGLLDRFATEPDVLVYADPPYLGSTRIGRSSSASQQDYLHDMMAEEDHERLAEALHRSPAMTVLSSYPSDLYDALYRDWERIDVDVIAHSSNSAQGGTRTPRTECLWVNFDPPGQLVLEGVAL